MASTDDWLAWLQSCQGIVEDPAHSNMTPLGAEYGWNGVAWCCITQSLGTLHTWGNYVLHTAGVADARARAENGENGMLWLPNDAEIRVGDLPCFGWNGPGTTDPNEMHIGGVINPGTQDKFQTAEGNLADRFQYGVWRDRTYVMGFIRLPFDTVGLGSTPTQEDDMFSPDDQALLQDIRNLLGEVATQLGDIQQTQGDLAARVMRLEAALAKDGDSEVAPHAVDNQLRYIRRADRRIAGALNLDPAHVEDPLT
jgi:hypothetical protein